MSTDYDPENPPSEPHNFEDPLSEPEPKPEPEPEPEPEHAVFRASTERANAPIVEHREENVETSKE